ncbi:MAG: hypothetical protein JWM47_2006 [Acidimicrobiales bacterium]|nr:hypothetical protein [Acidimicrobiales bacterium]
MLLRGPADAHRAGRRGRSRSAGGAGRIVTALLVVAAGLLGPARPAAADPAEPTDYRSRIVTVRPALPRGVQLRVVGGDAFLQLEVERGHTVTVPDYQQGSESTPPPYLRVDGDGTVRVNERSIAAAINESRFGSDAVAAQPDEDPRWTIVGEDGRYSWHDHRIHWMSPNEPTGVGADRRVDMGGEDGTWLVELEVDGSPVTVVGELLLYPSPSPVPWLAVVVLTAAVPLALALAASRGGSLPPHRGVAGGLAAIGVLAVVVGTAQWRSTPAGAGGSPLTAAIPAVAVLAAIVAAAVDRPRARLAGLAGAAAALAGWALLRRTVLFRAVLPTSLPFTVDRLGTALALGAALGTAALLAWRPPTARSLLPPASPAAATTT